jgi:predicted nucleotide-binding protein
LSEIVQSKAISRYRDNIESKATPYTIVDYVNDCVKSTPNMTRDSEEIAKGKNVPAHIQYLAPFQSLDANRTRLRELAGTLRKTIEAVNLTNEIESHAGTKSDIIFIGHGRSEQWRVLKDFVKERLRLSFEEFNRVSPAGISTQERLGEMLNKCGFAFLVFTAEDVHTDNTLHARENIIHEAGLFQGRLGWRRAIVLLEDGCQEFSNIVGLGQIRFSKGNIASCFEEVRRVLEREEFLK